MERLRLWRYKKLATEDIKDVEQHSNDEDYKSSFSWRSCLKDSCAKIIAKQQKAKELTVDDLASVVATEKFISKHQKGNQVAEENRKTLHKCLLKILNRKQRSHHQSLKGDEQKAQEEDSHDVYVASGIYDKFGNSCTESLKQHERVKPEVEAEDLSTVSWYRGGIIGNFAVEILEHQTPGSFIIHKGSHSSGNFILSLRVPSASTSTKVVHHLIVQSKQGYRLKGATKLFPTVKSLVTHHSVMAEQLPVTLSLQRPLSKKSNENDDVYSVDLEDLGTIFTDLEM